MFLSCWPLGLFCTYFLLVKGFDFSTSPLTQCGNLDVTWSGGEPPFRLLLIPPAGSLRNISIPSSAFDGTHGSFRAMLNLASHQRLMISMSDATGITAGGVSDVLIVGEPGPAQSCNTTDPGVDFFFSLDSDLKQCEPYPFTNYPGAIQPITITAFIPLSQAFVLYPAEGSQYVWTANLTAGTSVSFSVIDALGRVGGTSNMRVVQRTDNANCLTVKPTITQDTPSTSSPPNPTDSNSNALPPVFIPSKTGLIIGLAVGGCALVAVMCILAFFYIRRTRKTRLRPRHQKHTLDLTYDPVGAPAPLLPSYLLSENDDYIPLAPSKVPSDAVPLPNVNIHTQDVPKSMPSQSLHLHDFGLNSSPSSHEFSHMAPSQPSLLPVPYCYVSPQTSTTQSKQSKKLRQNQQSHIQQTSHVIIHSDIDETVEPPIELPPQYSEYRTPIPGLAASEAITSLPNRKRG